jgi:hypothetical protein
MPLQNAADGLMVAVKSGRVEPTVGLEAATVLAKFNDILGHVSLQESAPPALSGDSVYALKRYIRTNR